jgi:hypothetical protein
VEAPLGWLGFMSWMSAYVESKASSPYTYGRGKYKLKLNKVIYADDGTYLSSTRKGAQKVLNAVADFATATGIMIKPAKSYTYSNREGPPLTVTTYEKSNTRYKLRNKLVTKLDELEETSYFRHLGNVQNAEGHTPTEPMIMYDGSKQDNILAKVSRSMAALAIRNITIGGVMQVLQAVVVRQILYPTTFGNMGEAQLQVLQNKMQSVIKKKLRYPRHMKNEVLYAHEHAGGVGLDHIQTLVNTNRLMLLVNCLSQGGEMERIMIGAVQRLKEYVGTETCPLQHKVTEYTAPRADMWLYTLKVWMEKENITVKWNADQTEERGIMDACTKKQDRRDIWKWVRQTGYTKIRDLLYPDGDWREDIMNDKVGAAVRGQINRTDRNIAIKYLNGNATGKGRWITMTDHGNLGWVIQRPGGRNTHKRDYYHVEEWVKRGRVWVSSHKTWWRKHKCREVKIHRTNGQVASVTELRQEQKASDAECTNATETADTSQHTKDVGLYTYYAAPEVLTDLQLRGESDTQVMWVASDGSVLDSHAGGTWAWVLLQKRGEKYYKWEVEAVGRESFGKHFTKTTRELLTHTKRTRTEWRHLRYCQA